MQEPFRVIQVYAVPLCFCNTGTQPRHMPLQLMFIEPLEGAPPSGIHVAFAYNTYFCEPDAFLGQTAV